MRRNTTFMVLMSTAVLSSASPAQDLLHEFAGDLADQFFGTSCVSLGDLDGDGVPEVAVSGPGDTAQGLVGVVRVISSASGAVVYEVFGEGGNFGSALDAIGDVNGDGVTDLVVGANSEITRGGVTGRTRVLSGRTGSLIYQSRGPDRSHYGSAVAGVGDIDGDGLGDYAVGAPRDAEGVGQGAVTVLAGAFKNELLLLRGDADSVEFGWSVAGVGDVDGDGVGDLAVGDPQDSRNKLGAGSVHVFSGATGALIYRLDANRDGWSFGYRVATLGDVDNDGRADFLVSAPALGRNNSDAGRIYTYSGLTGTRIATVVGKRDDFHLGSDMDSVGDLNGDGVQEFAASSFYFERGVSLYDGATSELQTWFGQTSRYGVGLAAAGDLDGDGLEDLWIGNPDENDPDRNEGILRGYAGDDLYLFADLRRPSDSDPLQLRVRGGSAGSPVVVFLEQIDGNPIRVLIDSATLNQLGSHDVADIDIPPGLAGTVLEFRAYALDAGLNRASTTEVVTLR